MIVLGIDPGVTTGWVVYDCETRRVVDCGQFPEHQAPWESGDLPDVDHIVIERPKGQGPTLPSVVECGITFGRLDAWCKLKLCPIPVHEMLRYDVKSVLSAATHGEVNVRTDATAWAALALLHGPESDKKAKRRKGQIIEPAGAIGGVVSHERAALAVAVAWAISESL